METEKSTQGEDDHNEFEFTTSQIIIAYYWIMISIFILSIYYSIIGINILNGQYYKDNNLNNTCLLFRLQRRVENGFTLSFIDVLDIWYLLCPFTIKIISYAYNKWNDKFPKGNLNEETNKVTVEENLESGANKTIDINNISEETSPMRNSLIKL